LAIEQSLVKNNIDSLLLSSNIDSDLIDVNKDVKREIQKDKIKIKLLN
jgi:hypothetical protein